MSTPMSIDDATAATIDTVDFAIARFKHAENDTQRIVALHDLTLIKRRAPLVAAQHAEGGIWACLQHITS